MTVPLWSESAVSESAADALMPCSPDAADVTDAAAAVATTATEFGYCVFLVLLPMAPVYFFLFHSISTRGL
mgnify:CR=1 FL=1